MSIFAVCPFTSSSTRSGLILRLQNCEEKFAEVAASRNFNFVGNVNVGVDLPLAVLAKHYNAIVFSYGASQDRKLGIPGEDSRGVYSARDFVGWYNGLPENSDLQPSLESAEEAVVIGQGNVALDVARVLMSDVDKFRETDITAHALDVLSRSRVKRVHIVGRRGPMQAAFTIKEARELINLPNASFEPIEKTLFPLGSAKSLPRTQRRMVELLSKASSSPNESKSCSLDFLLSPILFENGEDGRLSSIKFTKNELLGPDVHSPSASVRPTDQVTSLKTGLAFRSIGYKSEGLPGMDSLGIEFDKRRGIIVNDGQGRAIVTNADHEAVSAIPGVYCSGWVKRGPAGVIANTMEDAFSTAEAIISDHDDEKPFLLGTGGLEGMKKDISNRTFKFIDWAGWQRIDAVETQNGQRQGKPREKLTTIREMLDAAA